MTEPRFYTYIHKKADTGEVFYVGKGQRDRATTSVGRSEFWERVVNVHGFTAEIVKRFSSEREAFAHEVELIASYRSAGIRLCNATDGGEGPSGIKRSEETKRRMSDAAKARIRMPFGEEARANMRKAQLGKKMSQEAIEKTASFHRGRKRSQETLDKMSAALKGKNVGRIFSDETRAKLSAAKKGKPVGDDVRKKISESHATRTKYCTMTDDHKAKIMAGQAAYWERWRKEKERLKTD